MPEASGGASGQTAGFAAATTEERQATQDGIVLASTESTAPGEPHRVASRSDDEPTAYSEVGLASWYGTDFAGRETANGETFDHASLTAAHPSLPLPCYARVTNLGNNRSVIVRVNDRGPYVGNRLIDVSEHAAELLGFRRHGVTQVKVEYVAKAPLHANDEPMLLASYRGPLIAPKVILAKAPVSPKPQAVAFASEEADTSPDASMMQNLTERASAVDRILMAFDVASATD